MIGSRKIGNQKFRASFSLSKFVLGATLAAVRKCAQPVVPSASDSWRFAPQRGSLHPGESVKVPLYVTVVEPKAASWPWRFLQNLMWTCCTVFVVSSLFVAGGSAIRKYTGRGGGMSAMGAATTQHAPPNYNPKEYNKEALPEKVRLPPHAP